MLKVKNEDLEKEDGVVVIEDLKKGLKKGTYQVTDPSLSDLGCVCYREETSRRTRKEEPLPVSNTFFSPIQL